MRLEKGRGLTMAGVKTEMNKWWNSARNEALWCQLEHEAFEKNSGREMIQKSRQEFQILDFNAIGIL